MFAVGSRSIVLVHLLDLLLKQLNSAGPNRCRFPCRELLERWQKVLDKLLARLARKEGREVVNGNDIQGKRVLGLDRENRAVKSGGLVVDGKRVVGVGGVAADVANDGQFAFSVLMSREGLKR